LARAVHRALEAVPRGERVMVATSGGADSTALALVAVAVAPRGHWSVRLVTVDHGLREASASEADAVEVLAKWLGVGCDRRKIRLQPGPRLSARARALRYQAIVSAAQDAGAGAVLTAHHAEDQLETVLMRLVRGAGPAALGGIRARRTLATGLVVLRPLLERSRSECRELLARLGIPWCEDPGNLDRTRPRGRLRHEVLPLLEAMRPGAAIRASRAARRVRGAAASLRQRARRLLPGVGPWERAALRRAPAEALALALRLRLDGVSEATLERMVEAIRESGKEPRRFRTAQGSLIVRAREVSLLA
jgi:tRNA(Ile)-lysidine synthase